LSPTRYRSYGGGGGSGSGDLQLGPDFGEKSDTDGNTWTVGVQALNLDTLAVENNKSVGVTMAHTALDVVYNEKLVGVTSSLDLGVENSEDVRVTQTFDALGFENTKSVGTVQTFDDLNLENLKSIGVHLSGTVLGAPFWQSVTTAAPAGQFTFTIPKPAGTQLDDLLVAFIYQDALGDAATAPAGWTKERYHSRDATQDNALTCFWKIATAAEVAATNFSFTAGANNGAGEIHLIRGVNLTTPINISQGNNQSLADPIVNGVTTTVANCLIIMALVQSNLSTQTYDPPAGYTENTDFDLLLVASLFSRDLTSARKPQAAAAATGNQAFNSTGLANADYAGMVIAVAPGETVIAS
jgi:hypothetical protein